MKVYNTFVSIAYLEKVLFLSISGKKGISFFLNGVIADRNEEAWEMYNGHFGIFVKNPPESLMIG